MRGYPARTVVLTFVALVGLAACSGDEADPGSGSSTVAHRVDQEPPDPLDAGGQTSIDAPPPEMLEEDIRPSIIDGENRSRYADATLSQFDRLRATPAWPFSGRSCSSAARVGYPSRERMYCLGFRPAADLPE